MAHGMHNTRYLRFLLILGTVVITTILVYASYSSSSSLSAPIPHVRTAAVLQYDSAHLNGSRSAVKANRTASAADIVSVQFKDDNGSDKHNLDNNIYRIHDASAIADNLIKHILPVDGKNAAHPPSGQQHHHQSRHREPTIDADAGDGNGGVVGGAGASANNNPNGNNNNMDDMPDDLLEEQYVQNLVDNTIGNINNSAQPDDKQKSARDANNNNKSNNSNKLQESDVLIPGLNLQKFIDNADKILKNMSSTPDAAALAKQAAAAGSINVADTLIPQQQMLGAEQQVNVVDLNADNPDEDAAQPPSVIMSIKSSSKSAKAPASAESAAVKTAVSAAVVAKTNATKAPTVIDLSQGVPTRQIYEPGHMNEELNIDKICPQQGKELKLLVLITSAQAHNEARLAIRQTWGHYGTRRDVSMAFVLGRNTNETLNLALTQENFIYGDLIRGHFIDSYNNLTLKTISTLEWVDTHCNQAKYILKTDDDMFINVPKLLSFLDSHSKEKRIIYGRLAKKWKPIRNKKSKYYVSTGQFSASVFPAFTTGPAYVFTQDIVHDLYTQSLEQLYLKLEDVFTTGIVAQQLNIKRVHANEFLNRRIPFNPCNIRKTISVHMIKSNEQFDLWKKLLDQSTKCK